jgi:hypothetical protein
MDPDKDVKLGDRVEIYCTNLDMSTNAFDRYYVAKGDQIVDVWPIMGRTGPAQPKTIVACGRAGAASGVERICNHRSRFG